MILRKTILCFILAGFSFLLSAQEVKRVVSLTPSITENIYLIGESNKLVGCTNYCTLAVKDKVEQVGSAVEVNVEKKFCL